MSYEQSEIARLAREMEETKNNPDKGLSKAVFREMLVDEIDELGDVATMVVNGDYGAGAYYRLRQSYGTRQNTRAILLQIIGALEYDLPQRDTNKVWNSLNIKQQARVNKMLDSALFLIAMED